MPKDKIITYFKQENEAILTKKELRIFYEKTNYVRTYSDYYNLVESLPRVKNFVVKNLGGKAEYIKQKEIVVKKDWRIYRSKNGGLHFIEKETKILDKEKQLGQRIDTLPKY